MGKLSQTEKDINLSNEEVLLAKEAQYCSRGEIPFITPKNRRYSTSF